MTEALTSQTPMDALGQEEVKEEVVEQKVFYRQIRPSGVKLIPPPSFGMIEDQLYRSVSSSSYLFPSTFLPTNSVS